MFRSGAVLGVARGAAEVGRAALGEVAVPSATSPKLVTSRKRTTVPTEDGTVTMAGDAAETDTEEMDTEAKETKPRP